MARKAVHLYMLYGFIAMLIIGLATTGMSLLYGLDPDVANMIRELLARAFM